MNVSRIRSNKRWSFREIATIVNYLYETGNIEQPTAQIYYRKFLDKTQLKASWDLVRWKVRHLRNCYEKAEKWLQSIRAGIVEYDKDKLKKICPHFDKLKIIFGQNSESNFFVNDSETTIGSSDIYQDVFSIKTLDENTYHEEKSDDTQISAIKIQAAYSLNNLRANSPQQSTNSAKVTTSTATKRKTLVIPSKFIAAFTQGQELNNANQRLRLKFEKEKFYKEFEFNKEKFQIEAELRREEIEMKKSQMEREEKFKRMEMEYNERIAKYEMDLKYKSSQDS